MLSPVHHSAERWAHAVVAILDSPTDPKTVRDWSKIAAASPSSLRAWCLAAHISPKLSLDFARVLRAVCLLQGRSWDPCQVLDVIDSRTLRRLLAMSGLQQISATPDVATYFHLQRFIRNQVLLDTVIVAVGRGALQEVNSGRITADDLM